MTDYSTLSYYELRTKLINGELEHEYMTEFEYSRLHDSADKYDEFYRVILEYCIVGYEKTDYIEGIQDIKKKLSCDNVQEDINRLYWEPMRVHRKKPYEEIRIMILSGRIGIEQFSQEDLEHFLDCEVRVKVPNQIISNFYVQGLQKFAEYENISDFEIFATAMKRYRAEKEKSKIFWAKLYRLGIAAIISLSALFLIIFTSSAFGYNIFELIKKSPTHIDYDDVGLVFTESFRTYSSLQELREVEKIDFTYPVKLPDGYGFANIEVNDKDTYLEIKAYASEPHIYFRIEIGAERSVDYTYAMEFNGNKYNIFVIGNGLYQAEWESSGNYYSMAVNGESILFEIINNLQER